MFVKINSMGLYGLNAFAVTVEVNGLKGQPAFEIVGLPDAAVTESRERIRSAMANSKLAIVPRRITVNLAPANVRKTGTLYDLPILIAVLSQQGDITADLSDCAFIGELSLGGDLKFINGALTMVINAKERGIKKVFLPFENAREVSVIDGIEIYGVKTVNELINHINNDKTIEPSIGEIPTGFSNFGGLDFADVKGQTNVKCALEIAAAGGHNVLLIGSPGTGKSMLAKRLPTILPQMTFDEAIETTQVYSVAGMIDRNNPLITSRPFRDLNHTASAVGLVGGGTIPRPGEISLAHNGVLFLDELPEFDRKVLETLRQPMESKEIVISRAAGSATYPCDFMLIAAMNPCPCGCFGHPKKECICSSKQVHTYLSKISGPMIDRIDIQVDVAPVEYLSMASSKKGELSEKIRERVQKARDLQLKRYNGTGIKCNSGITSSMLDEVCVVAQDGKELLKNAFEKLNLSARAYDRILKVSRTIADLAESEIIAKNHIAQAIQFRSLDKKYWGNR